MRSLLARFKKELRLYQNILADPRTPRVTKILLGAAIAYTLSPIDLIPDFIPVLGHLDDLVIVPLLIYCALRTIPRELVQEHRRAICRSADCF
jgi:uncharacterized membrane protein YkvA (DUF1232 family)